MEVVQKAIPATIALTRMVFIYLLLWFDDGKNKLLSLTKQHLRMEVLFILADGLYKPVNDVDKNRVDADMRLLNEAYTVSNFLNKIAIWKIWCCKR